MAVVNSEFEELANEDLENLEEEIESADVSV